MVINNTQLMMKINDDQMMLQDLKFVRIMTGKRPQEHVFRVKAKSLEQW
jgi:hypothetical protein